MWPSGDDHALARGKGCVNRSATFRSVCILQNHLRLYATLISYELIWHCISLVFLVRPQSLSLNYVANIAVEYCFIVTRHLEMHQVPYKELFDSNTFQRFVIKITIYLARRFVEFVTMFKL